jgi:methionine-rich copper-binding protein CopC
VIPIRHITGILAGLWLAASTAAHADTVIVIQNNFGPQTYGFQFVSSDPYNYEKLSQSPKHISVTFSQPPEKETSAIEVYNLYGARINDPALTITGNTMSVSVPSLPPGRYKVKWKAQCHCAERLKINDIFRFVIR